MDFTLRCVRIFPGVNSRAELVTLASGLHPGKCEHSEVQSSSMIAGASLWLMGGPPTDLKNMADCQEWKGQRFKKIYVRKTTQHEEKYTQFRVFPIFTSVDITIYQHGKCFIFFL